MKMYLLSRLAMLSLSLGMVAALLPGIESVAFGQNATDGGVEVLTRGPIHEAFADVSVDEMEPNVVMSRSVPEPIEELPPEYRPEGANVAWIPGYWSWDDEQEGFIWVSGVWRDVPPDRQWVPGYWTEYGEGNQYISGFWAAVDQTETEYLPAPPAPQEAGPSSPAPALNHTWTAGHWVWYESHYVWQPGYWVEEQPNLVWIPAHYVWTPIGYVFVLGYWDYQLTHRGVMFAPLYFRQPIYTHSGYYYTPSIVLDIDSLMFGLFIRLHSHHHRYYFGDYYDSRYENRGFHPWYSQHATRYGYDPFYTSYRARRLREDQEWENRLRVQYDYRRDHQEARPPRTYAAQANFNYQQANFSTNVMIGKPFIDVVKNKTQPMQFTRMNSDHQLEFQNRGKELTKVRTERKKLEVAHSDKGKPQKPSELKIPVRRQLPVSPVRAKSDPKPDKGKLSAPGQKSEAAIHDQSGKPQEKSHSKTLDQPQDKQQGKPQVKPQDQPQQKQPGKPQVKPQDQPRDKQPDKPQVKPQDQPQQKQPGKPQVKPQDQPQDKQPAKPQVKPQDQPRDKQPAKPQVKPQDQPRDKQPAKPQVKPQDQPQQKQPGKPQVKPQDQPQDKQPAKPEVKPQDQPKDKQQGKPQVKPQDQPQDKQQGKPQVKPKERKQLKPGESSATPTPIAEVKKDQEKKSR